MYSMNKTEGRRKMFIARLIEQLLSTFSSPFFGVKLLYNLWIQGAAAQAQTEMDQLRKVTPPPFSSALQKFVFSFAKVCCCMFKV